jgi:hypothetical protein
MLNGPAVPDGAKNGDLGPSSPRYGVHLEIGVQVSRLTYSCAVGLSVIVSVALKTGCERPTVAQCRPLARRGDRG